MLGAAGAVALHEVDSSERAALDDRLRRTAELSRADGGRRVQNELPRNDPRLDAVLRATGSSLRLTLGRVVADRRRARRRPRTARLPHGLLDVPRPAGATTAPT